MTLGQKLFSFDGRLRRRDWWLITLALALLNVVIGDVIRHALLGPAYSVFASGWSAWLALGEPRVGLINTAASLLLLWPWLAIYIKRHHDRDKGAAAVIAAMVWLYAYPALVWFVPLPADDASLAMVVLVLSLVNVGIGLWLLVVMGILEGTRGPNRFGPSPKDYPKKL